jgi:hypothetical protein
MRPVCVAGRQGQALGGRLDGAFRVRPARPVSAGDPDLRLRSPTRFYRDGSNLADGFTSGFPGRAFLRENILVLAFPINATSGGDDTMTLASALRSDGVRAAIEALVSEGSVDRERVGILGWSATGERVLNLVTFSDAPIAAATLLDGDSNTLVLDGDHLRGQGWHPGAEGAGERGRPIW